MWDEPRTMNAISLTLMILSVGALLWGAGHKFVRRPSFAFQDVVIHNMNRADPAHVAAVIQRELKGTFFTMNLDSAQKALQQVPWVRNAGLFREWPGRLEVMIEEFEPFASWNEKSLVTRDGEVFEASYDDVLPQLFGGDNTFVVIQSYENWAAKLLPLGLDLQTVRHSPRGSWQIEVRDKQGEARVIELGRDSADARLGRFVSVYQKTAGRLARAGHRFSHIDLRYRNGLTIRMEAESVGGRESGVSPVGRRNTRGQ